jgi:hypothetical protein
MRKSIIALGLLATAGCGKFQAPVSFAQSEQFSRKAVVYNKPQCVVDHVDYVLDAEFLSYEFKDKNGFSVGFNPVSGLLKAIGLSFDISSSLLTGSMHTHNFLSQSKDQGLDATASATGSEVGLHGKVDFGVIGLGFDHYSKTGVAALTAKGLQKIFSSMEVKMLNTEDSKPWMTRVITLPKNPGDSAILQVGAKAGVEQGDRFAVYNTVHRWKDESNPCNSEWLGERAIPSTPIAIVKVIEVQDYFSEAVIETPGVTNEMINQGARVSLESLSTDIHKKRPALGRSVWVRNMDSLPLKIDDKTDIDLKSYATRQIRDVISMESTKNRYYVVDPEQ